MTGTRRAIHFGAGNIGRGFIGPLLVQSDYHVIFADIDTKLIDKINELGEYLVHILDPTKPRPVTVSDISGVISTSLDDMIAAMTDPQVDMITTSVGVGVLPRIARTIARGISERRAASCIPMNIIACENAVGATDILAKAVDEYLSDEDREYVATNVGFANCAVDRIVPPFKNDSPLDVGVEGFSEWIVDSLALKPVILPRPIKGMHLTTNLTAYVERKLYTLNTGHAITAYLGALHNLPTIVAAIHHPTIQHVVRGAMHESGAALLRKYPDLFTEADHAAYIDTIQARFMNPNISDDVARVGREPLRKLGRGDRLLGPANMAREYGLPIDHLARGIAAAILYDNAEDPQAVEVRAIVESLGRERAVAELTGFEEGSVEYGKVLVAYRELEVLKDRTSQASL